MVRDVNPDGRARLDYHGAAMQLFQDFFPLLVFFAVFRLKDVYWATGALIASLVVLTAVQWVRHRKVSTMALVSLGLAVVFGGATIALQDQRFIQWKPTALYGLFAVVFLASQFWGAQPIVERLLGKQVRMEAPRWRQLNVVWVLFFVFMAGLNVVVMRSVEFETWVTFKTFGTIGILIAFILAQGVWVSMHGEMIDEVTEKPAEPAPAPEPAPKVESSQPPV
jgi:intracellular septation protein